MMRCKLKLNSFSYGHGLTSPVEFLCMNDPNLDGRPLSELPLTRYFGSPEGKEAWFNGKNHPVGTPIDMTKSNETDGYRIEMSSKTSEKQTYYLNVLQVGDCEPDTPPLPATLIETDKRVGAKIADRVVMFALDKGRTNENVEFSFEGEGTYKIMVAIWRQAHMTYCSTEIR